MTDDGASIDQVLFKTLRYDEILGAVAISREGLVVGRAGIGAEDAEVVGALGASLVGAAERTARRLGAGVAHDVSLNTADGMIHVQSGGDFAVVLFAQRCDPMAIGALCESTVSEISGLLTDV